MFKIAQADTQTGRKVAAQILEKIRSEEPKHWPNGLTVDHFDGGLYLVTDKQASAPVGFVGWQERNEGLTKIGYYAIGILPEHRRNGYASDAVSTLLAKKASRVDQVRAMIVDGNTPSVRLADHLGVPRKMIKRAEDSARKIDPWLMGTGLGVTGVNHAMRPLHRILDVQKPMELRRGLEQFKLLGTSAVSSADFPYLYAQFGHDLLNQKLRSGGSVGSTAEGLRRAKRLALPVLNRLPDSLTEINWQAPVNWFDRFNGQPAKNKSFRLKDLQLGLQEQLRDRGVHRHYIEFARSPLAAYQQTLNEIGEGLGNRPLRDVKQNLAEAMVLPQAERNAFMNKLYAKEMASPGDFNPLMEYLEKHVDLPAQRTHGSVLDAFGRSELFKHLRDDVGVVSHVNDYIGSGKNMAFDSLGELRNKRHFLQLWTDPILTGTFRNAPARYGRLGNAALAIKGLGGAPFRWLGLGALGASLYPMARHQYHKQASAEGRNRVTASDVLAAATTLGSTGAAAAYGQQNRWRINPWARPDVLVVGGVSPTGPTANRPLDSFSTQTHSVADALRTNADARVKLRPAFRPESGGDSYADPYTSSRKKFYTPVDFARSLRRRGDLYDAVMQVGASPDDAYFKARKADHMLRYRALTDFGQGNLKQPEMWLGARNWMKLHDTEPGAYTRIFAPGASASDLLKFNQFTDQSSLAVNSIPVNRAFYSVPFQPKLSTDKVRATLSMGGGAGGFLLVPEAKRTAADGSIFYDADRRNLLDDIMESLKAKHGDNFTLDVLTGGANKVPEGKPGNRPLEKFLQEIEQRKARGDARFANLNLHGRVPQVADKGLSVADAYSKSHYLFQLPGSTTAELLSMPGENVGRVINLVPDEAPEWMPKHYGINDDFVRSQLPTARRLNIASSTRLQDLQKIMEEGLPAPLTGRTPLRADYTQAAQTVVNDIRRLKLNRLAKFGLIGLPGALGAGYMASRAGDLIRPDPADMSVWDKLKQRLKLNQ